MKINIKQISRHLKHRSHRIHLFLLDENGGMCLYPNRKTQLVVKRIFEGKRTSMQAFLRLIEQDAALQSKTGRGIMETVNPIMPAASDKEDAH